MIQQTKRERFLFRFLRKWSLENLLPTYVSAISGKDDLMELLPEALLEPIKESLRVFQEQIPFSVHETKEKFDEVKVLGRLKDLSGTELLSYYVDSISSNAYQYDKIPEEIRSHAIFWLDELRECTTGTNGLFSLDFDIERFVDQFIIFAGGRRILEKKGAGDPENADYFFEQDDTIVELKILTQDFVQSSKEKLKIAREKAFARVKITPSMILGMENSVPAEVVEAENSVLRDKLKRRLYVANGQIKQSRTELKRPEAIGFVMFIVDGFYSLDPFVIAELLHESIQNNYSAVSAIAVVSFRRKVTLGVNDYFIFEARLKHNAPEAISDFADRFSTQWFRYFEILSGIRFSEHVISRTPLALIPGKWK